MKSKKQRDGEIVAAFWNTVNAHAWDEIVKEVIDGLYVDIQYKKELGLEIYHTNSDYEDTRFISLNKLIKQLLQTLDKDLMINAANALDAASQKLRSAAQEI
jgi:hypothetical protein